MEEHIIDLTATPGNFCRESWAKVDDLWKAMIEKDTVYERCGDYMSRHSNLDPIIRSSLLEWMMETCYECYFFRETFYLGVEYLDRYLSIAENISEPDIWSVGLTALFIAAKVEEKEYPRVESLIEIADKTGISKAIVVSQEVILLFTLKWNLRPVTPVAWLNLYTETDETKKIPSSNSATFILPRRSQEIFVNAMKLLDLCTMNLENLKFSTAILASAALYHVTSKKVAIQASGIKFEEIEACAHWMAPFAMAVREVGLQEEEEEEEGRDSHLWQPKYTRPLKHLDEEIARQKSLLNSQSSVTPEKSS